MGRFLNVVFYWGCGNLNAHRMSYKILQTTIPALRNGRAHGLDDHETSIKALICHRYLLGTTCSTSTGSWQSISKCYVIEREGTKFIDVTVIVINRTRAIFWHLPTSSDIFETLIPDSYLHVSCMQIATPGRSGSSIHPGVKSDRRNVRASHGLAGMMSSF